MSDIQKILELLQELEVFLKEHGDNSVANEQKILKKMIEVLLSEENEKIKFKNVIHDYKIIFQQKGGLAELR